MSAISGVTPNASVGANQNSSPLPSSLWSQYCPDRNTLRSLPSRIWAAVCSFFASISERWANYRYPWFAEQTALWKREAKPYVDSGRPLKSWHALTFSSLETPGRGGVQITQPKFSESISNIDLSSLRSHYQRVRKTKAKVEAYFYIAQLNADNVTYSGVVTKSTTADGVKQSGGIIYRFKLSRPELENPTDLVLKQLWEIATLGKCPMDSRIPSLPPGGSQGAALPGSQAAASAAAPALQPKVAPVAKPMMSSEHSQQLDRLRLHIRNHLYDGQKDPWVRGQVSYTISAVVMGIAGNVVVGNVSETDPDFDACWNKFFGRLSLQMGQLERTNQLVPANKKPRNVIFEYQATGSFVRFSGAPAHNDIRGSAEGSFS